MTISLIRLVALIGAFVATIVISAPTPATTSACPTAFPSSFKIQEGSGYFEASGGTIINNGEPADASYFHINNTYYKGPTVPQLAYTADGVNYGAYVTDTTNGTIVLIPYGVAVPNYYLPVDVDLNPDCTLFFSTFETHADNYLQICPNGYVELPTSVKQSCYQITASLA